MVQLGLGGSWPTPVRRKGVTLSTMEMRQAVLGDAAAVRSLTREAYAPWVALIGREPLPMTADYAAALRDHRIDLVSLDGSLAGLIETIPKSDHLLIENVAVLPAFQGRGLSRALMTHAEALAAEAGRTEIRLYTNARFLRNIEIYGVFGYSVDRREDWSGGTIIHMSKRLSGRS